MHCQTRWRAEGPALANMLSETLPALTIAYRTLGNPAGEAVMRLHGTTGNGSNFLSAAFADQMFGPGQPLDAARYFIILPDSIGTGDSSVMESEMARISHARLLVVPGSAQTAGHGTTAQAKWWKEDFRTWLQGVPKQAQ